jgi:hypothetical protein
MVRNDASLLRQNRINEISKVVVKLFAKHNENIPLKNLLAWISVNMGLTHKTALEYLEDICRVRGWSIDEEADLLRNPEFDKEEQKKK